ncbi:transporter [Methylorubrum thiocyanatum]|uniref:transporter n=1 Tax=Methylorubrum thiocyanatum TaxID=47958 RepID=UPI00383B8E5E
MPTVLKALAGTLALTMCASTSVRALDVDPGDYTALPPGTSAFIMYGNYAQRNSINVVGVGDINQGYQLDSAVGIARFVHWMDIAGITVDPQVLIPFGSLYNGRLGGSRVASSSGFGNPILAATAWLVNKPDPVYSTYFGITPFLTLPLGKYDRDAAVNIGSDVFQATLQAGLIQGIAPKFHVDLIGDVTFSTDSRVAGPGRQYLTRDASYQAQSYLRYALTDKISLAVGHSYTFGGDQYVGGIKNGLRTEGHQIRGVVQAFLDPTLQIQVAAFHDFGVKGGFEQDFGVKVRLLKVFAASK